MTCQRVCCFSNICAERMSDLTKWKLLSQNELVKLATEIREGMLKNHEDDLKIREMADSLFFRIVNLRSVYLAIEIANRQQRYLGFTPCCK